MKRSFYHHHYVDDDDDAQLIYYYLKRLEIRKRKEKNTNRIYDASNFNEKQKQLCYRCCHFIIYCIYIYSFRRERELNNKQKGLFQILLFSFFLSLFVKR